MSAAGRCEDEHGTRGRFRNPLLLALLCGALAACGHAGHGSHHPRFSAPDSPIQVVSTQVGGKNVFVPSTLVVTAGRAHTLSIYNTTDIPHGFRIDGLGVETILPPGEEHEVVLPAAGPQVLRINCHLHPPHRNATLVILPGR